MSLLITKHNKSGSNDGKHFNYFRRKSIHALIPQYRIPQCTRVNVTKEDEKEDEKEEKEEVKESKENEEDSTLENDVYLKNNY